MILRAAIEPVDGAAERRQIEVDVASFELGRTELDDLTPPGWRRLHIVTEPPA
ncbi:hypothetical protein [Nocardioides sp. SR21]|uniref:hypothetical protein n=1 Tax=Nocardioides sp. SR21 TaxID=2919501 RepID=UPI001FA9B013|nr:hypothetical protein [Nocardioides sp. SR21]